MKHIIRKNSSLLRKSSLAAFCASAWVFSQGHVMAEGQKETYEGIRREALRPNGDPEGRALPLASRWTVNNWADNYMVGPGEKLYFAAEITDNTPVVTGTEQPAWNDDNIMFCLYPWGWHMGESLNAGYYREHLGPLKGGKAGFRRFGNTPSGPVKADGAEIAVKRTDTGWVYEWAYPKASLHPLVLAKGGAFRLSMSVWDQQKADKKDVKDWGQYSWLTFSGFNSSVNALPNLWRQFQMVDNPANVNFQK